MISIPVLSSSLLLLAFLLVWSDPRVVDARSPSLPWSHRRFQLPTTTATTSRTFLGVPQIRGGESSSLPSGLSTAATASSVNSNAALPTPSSARIGGSSSSNDDDKDDDDDSEASNYQIHPSITGGHILRAGKVDPVESSSASRSASAASSSSSSSSTNATADNVLVETIVSKKKDKETKKLLKRHKQIAKMLKNRNAANKRRKFMHFSWGMLFASLNHFVPRRIFLPSMCTLSIATMVMELLRYRKGFEWMNNCLHFVLGKALRKSEMDGKFTGSFYYFSGVTLTTYLFPKSCATLGICQLAVADPTASYIGRATRHVYWSRINNGLFGLGRNKGILGFLGGAVCCVPLNYRLLSLALTKPTAAAVAMPLAKSTVLAISLALGLAGAFADLIVPTPALTLPKKVCGVKVPPLHLDDNIAIPIISGWACVRIFSLAGIPIPPAELALAKYLVV